MAASNPHLPGRLGDPNATLDTDPRADPRIVRALAAAGALWSTKSPVTAASSYEECVSYCGEFEKAGSVTHEAEWANMPAFDDVEYTKQTIQGVDGNAITLHIHRPKGATGPVPGIYHTHGGGMVLMTAADPNFVRWRNSLASLGTVVVGVEFRNGGGKLGNHPFPAGLNDCASGLKWTHDNKSALGISTITITGESGGGNLAIATTLKAKQEGWLDHVDGVYAQCPYISGQYAEPPAELLSLQENDGYMLNCEMMGALVKVYDPTGEHSKNPLAWPLHSNVDDLKGLPPHVVSVNELDPLRDEGLAYSKKLLAAGVPTIARTVNGTTHAGDQGFPDILPEVYQDSLRSLVGFAQSL